MRTGDSANLAPQFSIQSGEDVSRSSRQNSSVCCCVWSFPTYFSPTSKEFFRHVESLRQSELQEATALFTRGQGISFLSQEQLQTKFQSVSAIGTLLALRRVCPQLDADYGRRSGRAIVSQEAAPASHHVSAAIAATSALNIVHFRADLVTWVRFWRLELRSFCCSRRRLPGKDRRDSSRPANRT